jgi:hypothetical protein
MQGVGDCKEVQDTSCRGLGGVPQSLLLPQDWGSQRGLKRVDKDKGKMAAIMAAVNAYMEEEAMAQGLMAVPQRRPVPVISLWHVSGREEMMRMRQLWQRRIV